MTRTATHTFHTRYDFTPELGWAAFQLVHELGRAGFLEGGLEEAARATTSPLARRQDLTKILASFEDLGIFGHTGKAIVLTALGQALAAGSGAYETGFCAAIHCLYFWQWLWEGDRQHASPSWSYREVCSQLLVSPPSGISADELVLRVVEAADRFHAKRVSVSRSSVSGVTSWLSAQTPSLVELRGKNVARVRGQAPGASALRLNIAAVCALGGGKAALEGESMKYLAESLLVPADELWLSVVEYARDSGEFCFVPGGRGAVVFERSDDAFIGWIAGAAVKE